MAAFDPALTCYRVAVSRPLGGGKAGGGQRWRWLITVGVAGERRRGRHGGGVNVVGEVVAGRRRRHGWSPCNGRRRRCASGSGRLGRAGPVAGGGPYQRPLSACPVQRRLDCGTGRARPEARSTARVAVGETTVGGEATEPFWRRNGLQRNGVRRARDCDGVATSAPSACGSWPIILQVVLSGIGRRCPLDLPPVKTLGVLCCEREATARAPSWTQSPGPLTKSGNCLDCRCHRRRREWRVTPIDGPRC